MQQPSTSGLYDDHCRLVVKYRPGQLRNWYIMPKQNMVMWVTAGGSLHLTLSQVGYAKTGHGYPGLVSMTHTMVAKN